MTVSGWLIRVKPNQNQKIKLDYLLFPLNHWWEPHPIAYTTLVCRNFVMTCFMPSEVYVNWFLQDIRVWNLETNLAVTGILLNFKNLKTHFTLLWSISRQFYVRAQKNQPKKPQVFQGLYDYYNNTIRFQ